MRPALLLLAGLLGATTSRGTGETQSGPTGQWLLTLRSPNRGETVFRVRLERSARNEWTLRSRPGAARAFVSATTYMIGRLLRKVPAGGALVYVEHGTIDAAGRLRGQLRSPVLGTFQMEAAVHGDSMRGELRRDSLGPRVGDFHAVRDSTDRPLRDYPAIAAGIRRELSAHIFDPRLPATKPFREFLEAVDHGFRDARDDLDAIAVFYSRVRRVGTSHISLVRDPELAQLPLDSLVNKVLAPPDSLVRLTFPVQGIAYLLVRKWDQVTPAIDRAFARIDSAHAHTLIVDMRGNSGGDNSAGSPLAHLVRDSSDAGVFLTNKWFAVHNAAPTVEDRQRLPVVTRDEGMELIKAMREHGAVAVRVKPRAPYFGGRVYVLADNRSASASEPVAHFLKVTGRATVVGTRTAGSMLTALPHAVGADWVLVVPEADYYAADGTRLEGVGVAPDIESTSAEAMLAAARDLAKHEPVDGALFVGLAAVTLSRWDEAFDALERVLASRPGEGLALYLVGRAAAVSRQRLDRGEQALRSYLGMPVQAGLPSHAAAHWRLGMIQEARGALDAARQEYETALRLDPKHAEALASLGALNAARRR